MLLKDDTSIEFKFESAHAFVNLAMQGEEEWSLTCISFSNALQLVVSCVVFVISCICLYLCCRNVKCSTGKYHLIFDVLTGETTSSNCVFHIYKLIAFVFT